MMLNEPETGPAKTDECRTDDFKTIAKNNLSVRLAKTLQHALEDLSHPLVSKHQFPSYLAQGTFLLCG
jgi:hypothetical protein